VMQFSFQRFPPPLAWVVCLVTSSFRVPNDFLSPFSPVLFSEFNPPPSFPPWTSPFPSPNFYYPPGTLLLSPDLSFCIVEENCFIFSFAGVQQLPSTFALLLAPPVPLLFDTWVFRRLSCCLLRPPFFYWIQSQTHFPPTPASPVSFSGKLSFRFVWTPDAEHRFLRFCNFSVLECFPLSRSPLRNASSFYMVNLPLTFFEPFFSSSLLSPPFHVSFFKVGFFDFLVFFHPVFPLVNPGSVLRPGLSICHLEPNLLKFFLGESRVP